MTTDVIEKVPMVFGKFWWVTKVYHGLLLSDYEVKPNRKTGAYTKRRYGFCKNIVNLVDDQFIEFFRNNVAMNIATKVELTEAFLNHVGEHFGVDMALTRIENA